MIPRKDKLKKGGQINGRCCMEYYSIREHYTGPACATNVWGFARGVRIVRGRRGVGKRTSIMHGVNGKTMLFVCLFVLIAWQDLTWQLLQACL